MVTAESFHKFAVKFSYIYYVVFLAVACIFLVTAFIVMSVTQGFKNCNLILLLVTLFTLQLVQVAYAIELLDDKPGLGLATFTFLIFNDTLCHWLVTQTYIKVAFETKQLLDKDIYQNNREKLLNVTRFRRRMRLANFIVITAILLASACIWLGYSGQGAIYFIG